jgi:spore coat polysaccharide biosynthesis protein SpsF
MADNQTVAIVQARMGSSRFPGKSMELLEGAPVLEWVLRRSAQAELIDDVVLATTQNKGDDILVGLADRLGIRVFRGSEDDVLGRYAGAAELSRATVVVRICADRPLVDPKVIDMAVGTYRSELPDLAFNHISEGTERWPRGFGAEVLSASFLHWMNENANSAQDREHVTYYAWQHRDRYRIVPAKCPAALDPGMSDLKFDLDGPDDLKRLRVLCAGAGSEISAETLLARWRAARAA